MVATDRKKIVVAILTTTNGLFVIAEFFLNVIDPQIYSYHREPFIDDV